MAEGLLQGKFVFLLGFGFTVFGATVGATLSVVSSVQYKPNPAQG